MIEITIGEAYILKDFIETNFFEAIRKDVNIDNLNWAEGIISIYQKCKEGCVE